MKTISESKHHLESIFDSITDPIFTINEKYEITRLNKQFEIIAKKPFKQILGTLCYKNLYFRDSPCPECPLKKILKNGLQKEFKIEVNDNLIYKVDCFPLKEKSGKITAMVELARDISLPERMKKEIQLLQNQTIETSIEVNKKNRELQNAYSKISHELTLAREVQRGILPQNLPKTDEWNSGIFYLPMEEVGGDLYDFIQINPDLWGIIIVDVCGHGIPAAFIASMAKMSFYLHASKSLSTTRVLNQVNQDMCNNLHTDEFFLTMSYCLVDFITNTIKYSNAGHPPLLIYRHKTGQIEEITEKGTIIGLSPQARYNEISLELEKKDRLIFFTDGLFENLDPEKSKGMNYLKKLLLESISYPVEKQIDVIKNECFQVLRGASPRDDISLVIIEIAQNNKFTSFDLHEEFETKENLSILALRHPLDIEKVISHVLKLMDRYMYNDSAIRQTRLAIYEALNIYFITHQETNKPLYFAFRCTDKKLMMTIVDQRYFQENTLPYFKDLELRPAIENIKKNIDLLEFRKNGRKIYLEKYCH
ncbi:MAG: SpoIIE family protein phosphatase [Spirochaetales bacterium]|nr:SpoIIE family protein phosphatase [Spirochaetales bacterium]